jgi:arylsulfatase
MSPFALRRLSALGLAVCSGLVAVAAGRLHAREPARPPNVVFILSDDQHWQDYGFMGHPRLRTPQLDRLARESLVFTRGYVTASLCCPSLASIITGRYPHEHKIVGNDPAEPPGLGRESPEGQRAFEAGRARMNRHLAAWPTLPRLLAAAGYRSLQTGKWWQGHFSQGGFDEGMTQGRRHGDDGLAIGRETMEPIRDFMARCQAKGAPFFVWYAPLLPHTPHDPPQELVDHYAAHAGSPHVARYWANVERFDRSVGELLDDLDRLGLARDTLVVYVTDNGWIQDPASDRWAPGSKLSPADGGVRSPIMLRWPARIEPRRSESLASSLDILPTVLAAAAVKPPADLPGIDLLDPAAVAARREIHGACYTHTILDLDDPARSLLFRWAIRDDGPEGAGRRWKLVVPGPEGGRGTFPEGEDRWIDAETRGRFARGRPELFDLAADPFERDDVAAAHPDVVAALRADLDAWWRPAATAKAVDTTSTDLAPGRSASLSLGERPAAGRVRVHPAAAHKHPRPGPLPKGEGDDTLPGAARRPPNIVYVMTDDQGYGDLSAHGNPVVRTPHLDRLRAEGVSLTEFHASPTCSPTRAAFLTGRHEFRSGVTHTILERERLALAARTLPQFLGTAGYTSGIFGKWHLGDEDAYQPLRRGFDRAFIHGCGGIGQSYPGSCADVPGNGYVDPVIRDDGRFVRTHGYCTDVFFSAAIDWIEACHRADKPFFCYLATNAPHSPYDCPAGAEARLAAALDAAGLPAAGVRPERAEVARFLAMIENVDANMGRLLDALDRLGIADETLVVFTTDNGTAAGETVWSAGMRGKKGTPYRGGTRVPSFWRWRGTLPAGVDVAAVTAHIDVLPTLCELAGAQVPADAAVEGRSLVPPLRDATAPWPDRSLVTHVGRWEPGQAAAGKFTKCRVRHGRWSLVNTQNRADGWELYDVAADPGETTDVAAAHPDIVARLAADYDAWWASVQPELVNESAVPPSAKPFPAAFERQKAETGVPERPAAAAGRPNVLVVMCDQLGAHLPSCYGGPIPTPNIDRLAREGVRFDAAVCPTPFCSPSRASLVTGLYPHAHGINFNVNRRENPAGSSPPTQEGLRATDVTTESLLHAAGYATHHYGKWHLLDDDLPYYADMYLEHGRYAEELAATFAAVRTRDRATWQDWYGWALPVTRSPAYAAVIDALGDRWAGTPAGELIGKIGRLDLDPADHYDVRVADRAVARIAAAPRPFMITCSFNSPHDPFVAPEPWYGAVDPAALALPANRGQCDPAFAGDRARRLATDLGEAGVREYLRVYTALVRLVDAQVGRLLDALEAAGVLDDTIVVFTADHGDMAGGHGMVTKSTKSFYDEIVRIPLVIRYPRRLSPGTSGLAVDLTDLMPTLLDLVGQPVPAAAQGQNLVPFLTGSADPATARPYAFCERVTPDRGHTRRVDPGTQAAFMARGGGWKYVRLADGTELLHDLATDPGETQNLAADPAATDRRRGMAEAVDAWLARTSWPR